MAAIFGEEGLGYVASRRLAIVLQHERVRGTVFYRSIYILPYAIPALLSMLIWQGLLNTQFGQVNDFLEVFGIERVPWLTDGTWAKVSVITVNVWLSFPYMFLISTGALRLIESAELRTGLVTHYSVLEDETQRILMRVSGYPMLIHEYFPAELRELQSEAAIREFGLGRAVDGIRSERFIRVMNQELNLLYFMRPRLDRVLELTSGLIAQVESELAR